MLTGRTQQHRGLPGGQPCLADRHHAHEHKDLFYPQKTQTDRGGHGLGRQDFRPVRIMIGVRLSVGTLFGPLGVHSNKQTPILQYG
ncbi:hypothetical protein [Frankia sp. Cr1]|uniref:hypothetical protein n=1 Tax=Frankia sp. Cr1 TaxID=3073931 RepID=UPI002AD285D7|nr:hypothetical protein [Frankia sp. Cr1]